jgi:hypothetical protein
VNSDGFDESRLYTDLLQIILKDLLLEEMIEKEYYT